MMLASTAFCGCVPPPAAAVYHLYRGTAHVARRARPGSMGVCKFEHSYTFKEAKGDRKSEIVPFDFGGTVVKFSQEFLCGGAGVDEALQFPSARGGNLEQTQGQLLPDCCITSPLVLFTHSQRDWPRTVC